MILQLKHVALTYLTWRWIWFVFAIVTLFTVPSFASKEAVSVTLGMPSMMGLMFLAGVVKWQFANPRARLMPGYTAPHLGLFGGILLLLFVINPLALATIHDLNAWGLLSFSLLLSGCVLVAFLLGRGIYIVPAIAIFYSAISERTHAFWIESAAQYTAVHLALIVAGGGMIGYCFWFLVHLTEEMDEYQVVAMGGMNSSRVERAEQRKLLGNQIKKQRLVAWASDRWLDRGLAPTRSALPPVELAEYGIARTSAQLAATLTCVSLTLYALVLTQLVFHREPSGEHPEGLIIAFAMALPAFVVGQVLMQHRQRMGQELLRPASRRDYLNSLLLAVVKRSTLMWIGSHIGLALYAAATHSFPPIPIVAKFVLLSLATQFSAWGVSLHLSLWNSWFGYLMGLYVVFGIQFGTVALWWSEAGGKSWSTAVLLAALNVAVGAGLITWARRRWLAAELD